MLGKTLFLYVIIIKSSISHHMGRLEWIIGVCIVVLVVCLIVIYRPRVSAEMFTQIPGQRNQTVSIQSFFNDRSEYVTLLGGPISNSGISSKVYVTKMDLSRENLTGYPAFGWKGSVYVVEVPGIGPDDSVIIHTRFLPTYKDEVYMFDLQRKVWVRPQRIMEHHPNFPGSTVMNVPRAANFVRDSMVYVAVFTKESRRIRSRSVYSRIRSSIAV